MCWIIRAGKRLSFSRRGRILRNLRWRRKFSSPLHERGEERGRNVNGTFSLKDNPKIISQSSVLRDCHSTKFFLETPTCDEQQSTVQGRGAMYFHFSTRSGGKFLPRLSSLPLPFQRNRWARGERREVNSPIFRPVVDREKREETER